MYNNIYINSICIIDLVMSSVSLVEKALHFSHGVAVNALDTYNEAFTNAFMVIKCIIHNILYYRAHPSKGSPSL